MSMAMARPTARGLAPLFAAPSSGVALLELSLLEAAEKYVKHVGENRLYSLTIGKEQAAKAPSA
jgi:hypothetical protein